MQVLPSNLAETQSRNNQSYSANLRPDNISADSARPQIARPNLKLNPEQIPQEAYTLGQKTRDEALKERNFSLMDIFSPRNLFMKLVCRLLYHPSKVDPLILSAKFSKLRDAGLPIEEKFLKTQDDQFIRMWFAKHPNPSAPTKIYFHGNASDITMFTSQAIKDFQNGYNVCLTSYRGFSNTNGIPTEQGLVNDALAVFEELIDKRRLAAENIDIEAASLGCAVALNALNARSKIKNHEFHKKNIFESLRNKTASLSDFNELLKERFNHITLLAPFASIKSLGKHKLRLIPNFLKQLLSRDIWNNQKAVKDLFNIANVQIIHGDKDEVVPLAEGRTLFETLRASGKVANFIVAKDYDHNSVVKFDTSQMPKEMQVHECLMPCDSSKHRLFFSENKISHIAKYGYEHAIDIPLPVGSPVYAVRDGTVIGIIDQNPDMDAKQQSMDASQLNQILIKGDDGLIQQYAHPQQHSSQGLIKLGQKVKAGQHICNSGHNGPSTEPHLHFSLGYTDPENKITQFKSVPFKFVA